MGYAARANHNPVTRESRETRQLRRLLSLFSNRGTYEQWLTARSVDEVHRAHMEQLLPAHLKAQGSV